VTEHEKDEWGEKEVNEMSTAVTVYGDGGCEWLVKLADECLDIEDLAGY